MVWQLFPGMWGLINFVSGVWGAIGLVQKGYDRAGWIVNWIPSLLMFFLPSSPHYQTQQQQQQRPPQTDTPGDTPPVVVPSVATQKRLTAESYQKTILALRVIVGCLLLVIIVLTVWWWICLVINICVGYGEGSVLAEQKLDDEKQTYKNCIKGGLLKPTTPDALRLPCEAAKAYKDNPTFSVVWHAINYMIEHQHYLGIYSFKDLFSNLTKPAHEGWILLVIHGAFIVSFVLFLIWAGDSLALFLPKREVVNLSKLATTRVEDAASLSSTTPAITKEEEVIQRKKKDD